MRVCWIILISVLLFLPAYSSAGGGNYIIMRANVNPLYIEGESIFIQAFILVFKNNKPTDESATLHIKIQGLNVNYSYSEETILRGGKRESIYLPALQEGHYKITLYAEKGTLKSRTFTFDFGVSKPPVPYSAEFSPGGSKFYFKSLKLTENGTIDPNYPFTLKFYSMQHGGGETLVRTITNVTELTMKIPESWRHGILIVEVIDKWGWKNSATMDLSSFSFTGIPLMYDYEYALREPFRSHHWKYIIVSILIFLLIMFSLFVFIRWYNA